MRVLLVRPPKHNPRLQAHLASEPLSLEAVAGGLRDCEIELFDMQIAKRGLTETLESFQPQVVGISGYTADVYNMREVLAEIKEQDPEIFTVVGGHHATILPADFNLPSVDAIVVGMGPIAFAELIEARAAKKDLGEIEGLAFPGESGLAFTKERPFPKSLDDLPPPRRDLISGFWKKYSVMGKPIGLINTAKGCPYRCKFCSIINEMKGKYITKSAERVVEELATLPQRVVRFADGNTFGNIKRVDRMCELLAESGIKKKYMFDIRADTVVKNPELIGKWRDVGLDLVAIGLESINEERLRAMGKGSTVEDNNRAIDILHDSKVKIVGQFMIDSDFSEEDFDRLIDYVVDKRIHFPSFCITTPFPGTPLFDETRAEIVDDDYEQLDCFHSVLPTRLERDRFLERYVDLYSATYSFKRLRSNLYNRLFRRRSSNEIPFSLMLLIKLHLTFRKGKIRKEYGL